MNRIRIREIVRKEFIQLFRDRKNRPILVIMPFVQLLIFGYVVSTDVRDVKVGLLDQSRTKESRLVSDYLRRAARSFGLPTGWTIRKSSRSFCFAAK